MTKNKINKEAAINADASVNESHLYNLLFAGRISIREYLQQVRNSEATKKVA